MASVVFEDHPLESYFHDIGEEDILPGGSSDVLRELEEKGHSCDIPTSAWLPALLDRIYQTLEQTISTESSQTFVERFKYTVISSSLLSTNLPPICATPRRPLHTPFIPGANGHSRSPSSDLRNSTTAVQGPSKLYWSSIATLSIFGLGYHQMAVFLLAALAICYHQSTLSSPDMTLCLDTLHDLVAASDVWESVVQEAVTTLEKEERSLYGGTNSPSSPSSTLRVALHSSLLTTQTQSDNVRQLFSALTAPNEIAQISEMYAPPSPPMSTIALPDTHTPEHPRPFSLPGYSTRQRKTPTPDKRSTWSGSYAALAQAGSPTMQALKRREKRRSDLSGLLHTTSAPVSPALMGDDVLEEDKLSTSFGAAALSLRRRSRQSLRRLPSLNASRFTTMQTPRHPLSISSIQHALQSALAAKRYACSHLLALRFGEEYDEGYWEDVQSVIGLMTTTLVDASTRLDEAMEEVEHMKLAEASTPSASPSPKQRHNRRRSLSLGDESTSTTVLSLVSEEQGLSAKWNLGSNSPSNFAPMPSHLARFAAHVDAISSALADAQSHLKTCVKSLRDTTELGFDEDGALAAYDRVRRDLGMALRECERGKERLLDVVRPPPTEIELPALNLDVGSDESDKHDDSDLRSSDDDGLGMEHGQDRTTIIGVDDEVLEEEDSTDRFFGLKNLVPTSLVEQVYEADTSAAEPVFRRERSKLSREERIRLAKERRANPEKQQPRKGSGTGMETEMWGPGGDVVAELKDVIWQVGMKRRRTGISGGGDEDESPATPAAEPESIGIAL